MNAAPNGEGGPRDHTESASHHDHTPTTRSGSTEASPPVEPAGPWTLPRLKDGRQDRRSPHVLADRRLAKVRAEAHREAQERRARVLKHEDLRAALVAAGFRPECWNGYVPPRLDAYGRLNTSPQRRDLVDISVEAMRREREQQAA